MTIKNDLDNQHNRQTRSLCSAALLIMTMQASGITLADNVKMYDHVPSANEMANVLFPTASEPSSISKRPKTRSISFDSIKTIPEPTAKSVGIGLPIQFNFNSDSITHGSRPYIDELGKMLSFENFNKEKIVIEGHTDASGSAQYNQQLSMRRAKSIKRYLSNEYGIDRNRMMISGKGEYSPLSGKNPYAAVNRRVEIHKHE
ncbi:MAG: OmpA family protein [Methylococcales bacterium]|nr:OmpA family protein [Methylococcales bacterium]